MKTKILMLIGLVAVVTLSFTFSNSNQQEKKNSVKTAEFRKNSEPVGGFISEDKL